MKYPGGTKLKNNKIINYANRGLDLEAEINETNKYYIEQNIAFIYKKPVPIKITKVDYPSRNKAIIKEAFFEMPSTTDYNGIYNKMYIDFEAKETNNTTSFPLSNIHPHQIKHLENIINSGGIGFLIIRFNKLNETYLLLAKDLIDFISNNKRKSLPLIYIKEKGYIIKDKYLKRVDYLEIIDKLYGGN